MADVNSTIRIDINATQAVAQLRKLQSQISQFNNSVARGNAAVAAAQTARATSLQSYLNATGQFATSVKTVETATRQLGTAFDKGTLSARQYFRYAGSQIPILAKSFRSLDTERAQIDRLAEARAKRVATQYASLGRDMQGMERVLAAKPLALADNAATRAEMAAQKQQLFNRALQLGSTKMINWGKNTQWAGRQLMVGFTVPLTIAAGVAAKFFMELDKASMQFRRVYGDMNTSTAETERNLKAMQELGKEYTKYGIAVKDVIDVSARAAATGAQNADLMAATEQTLRLATLGQMEYQRALDATISLQTAFAINSEDLGNKIDFLNAVENQTVLTMEDMALAVPRVAPVIKGLGGDIEDLAVFMTALREGGVSAEQGANALKSGLASLINPTARARDVLKGFGINIDEIVQANRGDLMGTVKAFGQALNSLDEFERQQSLEAVFGKYQYARLGALFQNIANDASQSARAMELAGLSVEELRQISEEELGVISETVTNKFLGAIERLKVAIAPIGEMFLKAVTPIVNVVSTIAEAFANAPEPIKNAIGIIIASIGAIIPVFLMGLGLVGNAMGNILKIAVAMRMGIKGLVGALRGQGMAHQYVTEEQIESQAIMASLSATSEKTRGALMLQTGAVQALSASYVDLMAAASGAMRAMSAPMGGAKGFGPRGPIAPTTRIQGFNKGVVGAVPGTGNRDTVPAMLTPGESVITKEATAKYRPVLEAMNAGTLRGFNDGVIDLDRYYTSVYGETAARLQPTGENLARKASVPLMHEVLPILALRAGEIKGIPITQSAITAGLFDPIAKDLTGISQRFLGSVQKQFDTTFAHIADSDERLRQSWTRAGQIMTKEIDALPPQYRTVVRRWAGLDPDVVNTLATQPRHAGSNIASSRRQPIQTIQASGIKSLSEMNPESRLAQQRFFPTVPVSGSQDIGHIYGGTRVPMSYFVGMPGLTAEPSKALQNLTGRSDVTIPGEGRTVKTGEADGRAYNEGVRRTVKDPASLVDTSNSRAKAVVGKWAGRDAFIYNETFRAKVGTIAVPVVPVPTGTMPQISANAFGANLGATRVGPMTGKSIRVDGGVAQVWNPRNNPQNLGVPSQARTVAPVKELESSEMARRRRYEEERLKEQRQEKKESQARRVVDKRLTGAKREQAAVIGKETSWIDRQIAANQKLENQKNLNATALQESTKAEQSKTSQAARAAVQAQTRDMKPSTGGILSRPLGAARRFLFPQGRESGLRNLGISPYQGQQSNLKIMRNELPQLRKTIAGNARVMFEIAKSDMRKAMSSVLDGPRAAGREMVASSKEWRKTLSDQSKKIRTGVSNMFGGGAGGRGGMFGGLFGGGPVDPEERDSRARRWAGRGAAAGMGLSMGAMIPFMAQDQEGKFMGMNANMLGMGMMGAGALLSMVGLVSAKFIALAGLAAAAGVAIYALRNAADESARAAAEMGANLGVSANALRNMGAMMGKPTPSEQLAQVQLGLTPEQAEQAFGEFQGMFNTEQGQAFLEQIESATSPDRFRMLGDYVAAAIASGMMDVTTGQAFAKTIAAYLNDPVLGNAVAQAMTKQEKGTEALIDLAEKRMTAVSDSIAIKEVQRYRQLLDDAEKELKQAEQGVEGDRTDIIPPEEGAPQTGPGTKAGAGVRPGVLLSPNQASVAVGAAIQVIQDFSNAAALAQLEYEKGIISYRQYSDAIAVAEKAQEEYSAVIATAIEASVQGGSLQQGIIAQLEKIGVTEDQVKQIEAGSKDLATALNNGSVDVEANGKILGDSIAAVASGMSAADVVSILEFTKDATSQAAQFYQANMGQAGALQKTGLIGTIESGMMPGVVSEEDKQEVIDFVIDFEGSEADLQAFLASIPEERVMDVILNLKTMTPEQQTSYVTSAAQIAGMVDAQTQTAIESYISQRATGTTAQGTPSAIRPGTGPMGVQQNAPKRTYKVSDIEDDAARQKAIDEQQRIAEELQQARDSGAFEDIDVVIDVLLQEEPPDVANRLPEITQAALDLKENVPDEILKTLGIDVQNVDDLDKYGPLAVQLGALADVYSQIPDGTTKTLAVSMMLDENGDPVDVMEYGKMVARLDKNLKKLDTIDLKDTKKRKNVFFEIMASTVGPDGSTYDPAESQAVLDRIVEATGLTEAEFLALPTDVISKTVAAAVSIDTQQLYDAAAAADQVAAGFAKAGDGGLAQQWRNKAEGYRQAAAAAIQAPVSLPAANLGSSNNTGSGSGGDGGSGGGEEDPLKAMMKDLQTQKKLVGDYTKEQGKVVSGFAQALRNAGAPEYLIAEIIAKGKDGIDIAKKLLADKQKKLKELMKLSLEVTRMTFIEQQRAAANNFRTQSAAQNLLMGAGIGASSAIDIASDPANAAMIENTYKKIQEAERALKKAKGKEQREKARKELQDAKKAWDELTKSITNATRAEQIYNSKTDIKAQKDALNIQNNALTRLLSKGFTFEQAQEFAGNETIALAINSAGKAADDAARRVAYLDKKLKELKEAKGKNRNEKEIKRIQEELKNAKKEADRTSKAFKSLTDQLRSLSAAQVKNLISNTTKEYEGLTKQLGRQLVVLEALVNAGISYEQASSIANDPTKAYAFYKALKENGQAWKDLIAQAKAYDAALADISIASKVFEFQEQARKNLRLPQVNQLSQQLGGQYSGMVADALMGLDPAVLEAFFRLDPAEQKEWVDNFLASVPVAEKIKYLFDQITAAQRLQSLLNEDAANAAIGNKDALDEQLKAQRKLLKAEQDKLKVHQRAIEVIQEENDDYNRGLDLLSRQEEKINEAFDKRIEALDQVEQANARIAQQQQNQLNLAQALSTGDIYAATQAAQQIKQDNATAAIENTREALDKAREEQIKNLMVEVNGQLLTREQIEKRIEANNDRIYQIQEDQIEPIEAVIQGIQDQIENIETLKDAWQDYYDNLEKNAVDPLTGMKYSELEKIKRYYDALIATGLSAQDAFNQAMAQYVSAGGKITDEARLRGYFGVSATPQTPPTTPEKDKDDVTDIDAIRNAAIKALPELEKIKKSAKATKKAISETPLEIAGIAKTLIEKAQPQIDNAKGSAGKILNKFKSTGKYIVDELIPNSLTPFKDFIAKDLIDQLDRVINKFIRVNTEILNAIINVGNLALSLKGIEKEIKINITVNTKYIASEEPKPTKPKKFAGGLIKMAAGGMIPGGIPRDSVPIVASPGEFVVRNAMVDKYGISMLNDINQGSFEPRFETPDGISYSGTIKPIETNANSTMYNNNYNISVVAKTNANADEIANATVMKIRQMNSMQIRGARG